MSSDVSIPEDVFRFIVTCIPSVPYLEAMLLLREHAHHGWDSAQLAQRLYLSEKAASGLLNDLHGVGVLRSDAQVPSLFHYQPDNEDLRQLIDRLALVYSSHLVAVTHLIHSKTGKKAQHFADAFKWRKDS